ncbi:MAG: ABC transporter ATP-binding protein [Armatimonadota bacterium]
MAVAVKTEGLTKTYHLSMQNTPVNAVTNLDLEVYEGEIFGFLGPNGAGKTTTIKMLLGLTYPTSGQAWILGEPAGQINVKKQISYLPESPYFYDYMTGKEALEFYARLFGMKKDAYNAKVDELLHTVGLYPHRNKPLNQYSKGMLQRVGIAQALVNDPKLLFFDEPTSGLDPIGHSEVQDLILSIKQMGKTVFLSSHQLSDVELVCDRVAIMNRGDLLKLGTLDEMLVAGYVEIRCENLCADCVKQLETQVATITCTKEGCHVLMLHEGDCVNTAIDTIRAFKGKLLSVIPQRRTLEDLFVEIITEGNK